MGHDEAQRRKTSKPVQVKSSSGKSIYVPKATLMKVMNKDSRSNGKRNSDDLPIESNSEENSTEKKEKIIFK